MDFSCFQNLTKILKTNLDFFSLIVFLYNKISASKWKLINKFLNIFYIDFFNHEKNMTNFLVRKLSCIIDS